MHIYVHLQGKLCSGFRWDWLGQKSNLFCRSLSMAPLIQCKLDIQKCRYLKYLKNWEESSRSSMPLSERNGGVGTGRRREGEVGGNLFIVKSNRRHSAHLLAAAPSLPMSTSSSSSSSSSSWFHHYCYFRDHSHHNVQGGHEYTATDQAPSAWPKLNQWQKLQTKGLAPFTYTVKLWKICAHWPS